MKPIDVIPRVHRETRRQKRKQKQQQKQRRKESNTVIKNKNKEPNPQVRTRKHKSKNPLDRAAEEKFKAAWRLRRFDDEPNWITHVPQLVDVAVYVFEMGFLDEQDKRALQQVSEEFKYGSVGLPLWFTRPRPPLRYRRQGFGRTHKNRSCHHDKMNPYSMIHYTWKMWTPSERALAYEQIPEWKEYIDLRIVACHRTLRPLKLPRPPELPKGLTTLDRDRAILNSAGLLRFDFNYGDFIRWLGGEYTNHDRDWEQQYNRIEQQMKNPIPTDIPPVNLDRAFRIQSEGVPLVAKYTTPLDSTFLRNQYDNHPGVAANVADVRAKFAKEEWKSYHIHFLRFVFRFIPGIVINPIQWAEDKGKGRICINCTNGPGDSDGSINSHIPGPKEPEREEECPPIYYQTAFKRILRHLLRMRATRPDEPILVHADDIDAAFRRILYHPDVALGFAYVFEEYLLIPVGQVFGSRSPPSYYCVVADVRQAVTMARPLATHDIFHDLVFKCTFHVDQTSPLATVPFDSHFPPFSSEELQHAFYNASYVDDQAVVAYTAAMPAALDSSIQSAIEVFGDGDRRGGCLQAKKWVSMVSESFMFLGFIIDTHKMTVTWQLEKRQRLHMTLTKIMERRRPRYVTPKEMSHIIGVVRSASDVAPWGTFLSFNLENSLRKAHKNAFRPGRKWWNRSKIYLHPVATNTIRQLMETLLAPEGDPRWTRPIYLYKKSKTKNKSKNGHTRKKQTVTHVALLLSSTRTIANFLQASEHRLRTI